MMKAFKDSKFFPSEKELKKCLRQTGSHNETIYWQSIMSGCKLSMTTLKLSIKQNLQMTWFQLVDGTESLWEIEMG